MKSELVPFAGHAIALPADIAALAPFDDEGSTDRRYGKAILIGFFGLFLGWAALAPLGIASHAGGRVAVEGSRRTVQHREGGVVAELLVRDGARVRAGQPLIRLRTDDRDVAFRALRAQVYDLIAARARLLAESERRPTLAPPPELATLAGEDRAEMETALARQQHQLDAEARSLAARRAGIGQQASLYGRRDTGYQEQLAAQAEQGRLLGDELTGIRELAKRGFASANRVRALERSVAALREQSAQVRAAAQTSRDQSRQAALEGVTLDAESSRRTLTELRQVETEIAAAAPRLALARQRLEETLIRAPAAGDVVGLAVHGPGAVVGPGQALLDIVPAGVPLVIEASLAPTDAEGVAVGQPVEVHIAGQTGHTLPALQGRLTKVSADSLLDRRSGTSFYAVEVALTGDGLTRAQFETIRRQLRPGMPADVSIAIGRRTLLDYLLDPLLRAFRPSLSER